MYRFAHLVRDDEWCYLEALGHFGFSDLAGVTLLSKLLLDSTYSCLTF